MKANVVQSLLSRNRVEIRMVEEFAAHYKQCADDYFNGGDGTLEEAYQLVKYYRQEKATLAKLVELQKELKKELSLAYEEERMVACGYEVAYVQSCIQVGDRVGFAP